MKYNKQQYQSNQNRLVHATSPYLLHHARNPVAWQPWDDQAIEEAKRLNKPIFLSIGYAACHWCHVMERESFENEAIAAILNQNFINIKVDREERPDLDSLYMNAVVALAGQGGWPMTVFLTPDLKPFFGGTYFPPQARHGMPGFADILSRIAEMWQTQPEKLKQSAEQLTDHICRRIEATSSALPSVDASLLEKAALSLDAAFDEQYGGWSGAPKFPSPFSIAVLLRHYARTGRERSLYMAKQTLDAMARSGLFDLIGGGFHRYSVDNRWLVPHFEKMLYDNAQLASAYIEAWQITGMEHYRTTACRTLDYLLRERRHRQGAFYSSEDADSEGEEGSYYVWTYEEIINILGGYAGKLFCEKHHISESGNFSSHEPCHQGKNIPHVDGDVPSDLPEYALLLKSRCQRSRPATDDKIITAWNAMTISALARGAEAFDKENYVEAAIMAGNFLKQELHPQERLMHCWRNGRSDIPGFLEDYAASCMAAMDLYACSGHAQWLAFARQLADEMISGFYDGKGGAFYASSTEHRHLLARAKPLHDTAEPSGNALAARALLRLHTYFPNKEYERYARETIELAGGLMCNAPEACLNMILAADEMYRGPVEIVLAGSIEDPEYQAMIRIIGNTYLANRIVLHANESTIMENIPALEKHHARDVPTAWVCQKRTCSPPVASAEALHNLLLKYNTDRAGQ